jgi:hypothetical protein
MTFLQQLFRRNESANPIQESAAMTTVYLLEMNRKFEQFVRAKIEELEGVVTGLEARAASQHWRDEVDKAVSPQPEVDGEEPAEPSPLPETDDADKGRTVSFGPTADAEPAGTPSSLPQVADGYGSLRTDDGDPDISFLDPTVDAVDEAAELPAPEVTVTDDDDGVGAVINDDDNITSIENEDDAPLAPWLKSMGVGAKGAYE